MALIKADRVKETSTSTGTGTIALAGAATGYRAFSAVCAVGDTLYYAIAHQTAGEWEVGLATYSAANTLTRTTVHASSNSNLAVTFSAGTKDVFLSVTKAWLDTFITQTSGTTNYVAKATGTGTIGNSQIFDNGTLVGIGTTTNPSGAKLEIQTADGADSIGMSGYKTMKWESNSHLVYGGYAAGQWQVLKFYTNGAERYRVDASGNVGIGTTSPSTKLDVAGSITSNSASGNRLIFKRSSDNADMTYIGTDAAAETYISSIGPINLNSNWSAGLRITTFANWADSINAQNIWVKNDYLMFQKNAYAPLTRTAFNTSNFQITAANYNAIPAPTSRFEVYGDARIESQAAATKALIVKGAAAQSARYIELQDSTGTVIAGVNSAGMGEFNGVYSGENGKVQGFNGIELQAWNAGAMRSAAYVYKDLNMQIGGTITPNANIGSNQLLVINSSPSWAALRVKGASAQSANLQEWQNSAGSVLASIDSSGDLFIANGTATVSRDSVYTDYIGQLVLQGTTDTNKRLALGADTTNNIGFLQSYRNSLGPIPLIINPNNVGTGSNTVGVGNVTSPDGQFHVTTHVSSRKVLVARAHASQSVNIQEWQNSSGNAYAAVNNQFGAQFHGWSNDGPHGGVEQVCLSAGNKSFWASGDAALMTIGFVDIAGAYDGTNWSMYFKTGSSGSRSERMRITHTGNVGIGTTSPAGQLHTQATASGTKALVVRGASGQSANLQEWQDSSSIVVASIASNGSTTITNGTNIKLELVRTTFQWSGIRFTDTAGSFDMNGGGDGLLLITPAASKKALQVRGSASQTGNLQEWQNSSGTALASVSSAGSFNCSGFSTNEGAIADGNTPNLYRIGDYYYCRFTRDLPITAGSYVELFEISDSYPSRIEMQAWSYQHGVESTFRTYDSSLSLNYSTNGIFQPTSHIGANSWEIEKVFIAPTVCRIRIRRTKTVTASPAPYAIVDIRFKAVSGASDIKSYSGTGTSSVGNNYLPSGTVSQGTITPTPPVGDSGNGRDLSIVGGTAAGTGNGGSILLQAGAYSTSGSNGKVIVRGLASNTANLQEWQNNVGSLLSAVNSAGDFTNTGGYSYTEKFGNAASVSSSYATAIGYGTTAGQLSTAVGAFAVASGVTSTAFGADANAAGSGGTALGRSANAAAGAVAVGFNASASGNNGIAVGRSAIAGTGTAIGYNFTGSGVGYTSLCASTDGRYATGAIDVFAGDGVNTNANISRQHSILGTWATATYASRLGRVQLRVNDYTTDREAIRYESDGANALTSIGGAAVIASTTLAVQPAVSGNKGIVVKGASGQSANLQEWQNNSGTALASVTSSGDFNAGNLNVGSVYCSGLYSGSSTYTKSIYPNGTGGFFSREFCLLRTLPDTVGDYVELFEYAHTIGHDFKISIGAVDYPYWDTATYEHAAVWDSSSYAIPPKLRYHRGTSDFVLEKVHGQTGPYTSRFRVKRTGTRTNTGSSTILVIRVEAWLSSNFGQEPITMMSGTGTSSITGYVANSEYCNPALYPPPPLGWSGDGTSLSLYGANASGTGNGGNIILQAGAYSTSGSNGKVIVRGLASNTANLQEWQNNAGTALTTIDSAGRIGAETAPDSLYSVKAAGRIYAGNDIITAAGLVTRANAYDFTFGYGGPYIRRGFGGNSSTLYFGEDAASQAAFEFYLGVAMPTVGVMRVTASAANTKALIVKAAASQTANLQEWQNSSGTALALVDASGNVRTTGSIQITSNTPSAFTADQNNLVLSASGFQRLSGTAARTITGIAPPSGASHVDGRMMRIYNVGSYNITLKHNSTSSSIANRFCCVQAIDIVLGPRDFAELIYDGTDGGLVSGQNNPCWRVA